MVLVPFVHIHGTVEVGIHEERIVSQRAAYTQVVTHAVAFDIGFVDDVDTIFVTEFVETFLLGIVTGADGIDIVSLPKLEIFLHQFFGDIVTGILVVFVIVHAFHEDRLSVYQQLLVLDFHCTETYFAACRFNHISVRALQADDEGIEVGRFGCPLQRFLDGFLSELHFCLVTADLGRGLGYLLVVLVQQAVANEKWGILSAFIGKLHLYLEDTVPVVLIQRRLHLEVCEMDLRLGI